jgi:hypothetical protein
MLQIVASLTIVIDNTSWGYGKGYDPFIVQASLMIVTYDHNNRLIVRAGKSYWRGRLSTVDLLVLTSLDHLLFKSKMLFTFFTKQANLMRRSTVSSLPPQLVFPSTGRRCLSVTVILILHISLFAGSSQVSCQGQLATASGSHLCNVCT